MGWHRRFTVLIMIILTLLFSAALTGCANGSKAPPEGAANELGELEEDEEMPELGEDEAASSDDPLSESNLPPGSFDGSTVMHSNSGPQATNIPTFTEVVTGYDLPLKPVCFVNTGTMGATVMPWTYIPQGAETSTLPPRASTVASAMGSEGCLSLPLGEYSWCYHWELGDTNEDMMMDYAHSLWAARVVLDENDSDDLDLAERVTLSAPADMGQKPGACDLEAWNVLDIRPYILETNHMDSFFYGYSMVGMAHLGDYVTLTGPITVEYYYHHCDAAPCTTPVIEDPPIRVTIAAGESYQFFCDDNSVTHPGNWDLYVQLISIDG